jgi:hypothetical protein
MFSYPTYLDVIYFICDMRTYIMKNAFTFYARQIKQAISNNKFTSKYVGTIPTVLNQFMPSHKALNFFVIKYGNMFIFITI